MRRKNVKKVRKIIRRALHKKTKQKGGSPEAVQSFNSDWNTYKCVGVDRFLTHLDGYREDLLERTDSGLIRDADAIILCKFLSQFDNHYRNNVNNFLLKKGIRNNRGHICIQPFDKEYFVYVIQDRQFRDTTLKHKVFADLTQILYENDLNEKNKTALVEPLTSISTRDKGKRFVGDKFLDFFFKNSPRSDNGKYIGIILINSIGGGHYISAIIDRNDDGGNTRVYAFNSLGHGTRTFLGVFSEIFGLSEEEFTTYLDKLEVKIIGNRRDLQRTTSCGYWSLYFIMSYIFNTFGWRTEGNFNDFNTLEDGFASITEEELTEIFMSKFI